MSIFVKHPMHVERLAILCLTADTSFAPEISEQQEMKIVKDISISSALCRDWSGILLIS